MNAQKNQPPATQLNHALPVLRVLQSMMLPDSEQWPYRFEIHSETSNCVSLHRAAQAAAALGLQSSSRLYPARSAIAIASCSDRIGRLDLRPLRGGASDIGRGAQRQAPRRQIWFDASALPTLSSF